VSGNSSTKLSRLKRNFQPIAKRLNKVLLRIGGLFMLILIVAYAGIVYFDISSGLRTHLSNTVQDHGPRLTAALWDIDPTTINEELDALAALPGIVGVVLITPSGARYERGLSNWVENKFSYSVALVHKNSSNTVGTLSLIGDASAVWSQLLSRVLPFFIAQIILVLGILLVLQWLLRRVVVRRLDALTIHTHLLQANRIEKVPAPPAFATVVQDELDCLLEGFSSLQGNVLKNEQEREQLIRALAESRDQLEIEVAQRTGETLYLSGFLHMLSKDAQRYLDLPLDQAQFGLEETLAQTGVLLGFDALVAVCFSDEILPEEVYLWHKEGRKLRADFVLGRRALYKLSEYNLNRQSVFFIDTVDELDAGCGEAVLCRDLNLAKLVALPFNFNAERLGVLFVGLKSPHRQYSKLEMRILPMVVGLCSNVLAHHRQQLALQEAKEALLAANAKLALQANHDGLTDIANRRAFDESLLQEMRRATRSDQSLLLIILDVDFFKQYNDSYGHGEGDIALKKIAAVLAQFAERAGDCAARIGGEEFALLLPHTDIRIGKSLAERVRLAIIKLGLLQADGQPLTVSQGGAIFSGEEEVSPADFLRMADQALYRAKNGGRNQVCIAKMPNGPSAGIL